MLFNSYAFLFLFLPIFLAAWQTFGRTHTAKARILPLLLLAFSIVFYALWGLPYLALLACMITINYFLGRALAWADSGTVQGASQRGLGLSRRALLVCALVFNLLPLLWFKYSWFLIQNTALLLHADWEFTPPGLPLGISFYTFIQIAWLVDIYRNRIQPITLARHALFSACFPYVISGPIVRYEQIGWQFDRFIAANASGLASGFTLFSIGLAKKVLLADSIGFYSDAVFNAAEKAWPLSGLEAWLGSFCYSFQLYFDFSGYTDMAIGLALMIGLRLPENFNSPYKSTGIVDFWRRWHITLSSWLRDFLYIPLGGNRKGKRRQYCNLFLTMLIGGAWHGAGWTYIIWGALHGAMLAVNHSFRSIIRGKRVESWFGALPWRIFFIIFTFFCLNFCWVVFRAVSLDGALAIYSAMFGGWPDTQAFANGIGCGLAAWLPNHYFTNWQSFALLLICWGICWFFPNSQQILSGQSRLFAWQPTPGWAAAMALLAFMSLILLTRQSVFLYFQF